MIDSTLDLEQKLQEQEQREKRLAEKLKSQNELEDGKLLNQLTDKIEPVDKSKSGCKSMYGILLAFLTAFLQGISSIIIKKTYTLNGSEQAAIRYLVQLVVMSIVIKYKGINLLKIKKQRVLLFVRALLGTIGLTCAYFAFTLIDPADNVAIVNSSVIITAVISRFVFKERLSLVHLTSIMMALTAIIFISQPSFIFTDKKPQLTSSNQTFNFTQVSDDSKGGNMVTIGFLISAFTACAAASVTIILKKLSVKKVHYSLNIFFTSLLGFPVSMILTTCLILTDNSKFRHYYSTEPDVLKYHLFFSFVSACIGLSSQICFNLSLRYEDASKVAIIKSSEIFFVFVLQYFLLNIHANMFKIVGGVLMFVSVGAILTYKMLEQRHAKQKSKRMKLVEMKETPIGDQQGKDNQDRDVEESSQTNPQVYKSNFFTHLFFLKI